MYLGTTLAFSGTTLAGGSFWGTVLAGPLLGVFYFSYACGVEEPALLSRFGVEYRAYQARTALFVAFPLRHQVRNCASRLLDRLSTRINRPRMLRHREHILFWEYGMWPGIGVALGLAAMESVLMVQGLPAKQAAWIVVVVTIAGLTGTRMLWRLAAAVRDKVRFGRTAGQVGFVSWGALVGLLLMTPVFVRITGRSPYLCFDAVFPALMVAHVFGRIGCMFYGCCYGKETVTSIRLQYRHPALKAVRERRVHPEALRPVQLYSALYGGLTAALVYGIWYIRPLPIGVPAALSAILYGFCRLSEEWLRVQRVQLWAGISPAQMVALGLAAVGLIHLGLMLPGSSEAGYTALGAVRAGAVLQQIHPVLLAASGLLTAFVFSYHYRMVGQWRGRVWLSLISR
jgi:phosphatidylglycerol:prolipoprotein diacylglycerol transferase